MSDHKSSTHSLIVRLVQVAIFIVGIVLRQVVEIVVKSSHRRSSSNSSAV